MAVTLLGVKVPFIREEGLGAISVMKDPQPENGTSQTWLAGSFTYTSGTGASTVLNGLATNGTVIYGVAPHAAFGSISATATPPQHLFGFGGPGNTALHYPFDPRERIIEMNIASTTIASIGAAGGATWAGGGATTDTTPALAPGQQYGVIVPTSGTYLGYQFIDVSNTTNKLFELVGLAPTEITTSQNPRVWAKVIPSIIQG